MPGIHRTRPRFASVAAATDAPAVALGDDIWMSSGWSNSYLLGTDEGRVVLNTGMGFEGPLHRRAYDAVDPSPVRAVVLTQGHYDHVGGVDVVRDPDSDVVAQANFVTWRDDNERLEAFRSRNSAFAFMDAIVAAMDHARSVGVGHVAQARPEPTLVVDDRMTLTVGGRTMELIATPGGETFDSMVVWLPESRTLFSGNLFGPLFGHVPNLVTIRGDRYRDALVYIDSLDVVHELAPERLITGHFDPIDGADRIGEAVSELQDAMRWVHDRTVDGMNAGADVHALMAEIRTPEHLDVGEGYGQTRWNVRAIWENYAGWFHHRSTTELYAVAPLATAPDVVALAGAAPLVAAARAHLDDGRAVEALQLTDLVLAAVPDDADARLVARDATATLLERTDNFWESAWLRRSMAKLEDR
ncbi:MAG: alkyl sulfatase dimerization domain-containing protein [Microthrixaceae bacterium]